MTILLGKINEADNLIKRTQMDDGVVKTTSTEEQDTICNVALAYASVTVGYTQSVEPLNNNCKKVKIQYSVMSYDTVYTITVYEDGTREITEEPTQKQPSDLQ